MRTSFNKENNDNNDKRGLEVLPITEENIDVSKEEKVESIDADFVEVEDIESVPVVEDNFEEEEEVGFEEIFADGKFDPLTPDFHKIYDEVEKALREEESRELDDSATADFDLMDSGEGGTDEGEFEEEEDLFADDEDLNDLEGEGSETVELREDKKSFLNKKIVVGSVIVLVALGVSVGYGVMSNKDDAQDLEKQIERLYTSDRKIELKKGIDNDKLDKYYSKLENVDKKERVALEEELNTIAFYIEDKDTLDKLNDSNYNFNASDFKGKLEEVKKSVRSYAVPSLANTLKDLINSIEGDYKNYNTAKDTLTKNIGNKNANVSELQELVSKVNHTPNKDDLQAILNNIGDEVKANKIVNDIKESSDKKLDEVSANIGNKIDEASSSLGEKVESFAQSVQETVASILEGLKNFVLGEDENQK